MSVDLQVDGKRWRDHLVRTAEATPGIVPVAKGNGYGLGLSKLARRAQWLGVDTLAVGTYEELPAVADRYLGDLLVLTPWRPFSPLPLDLSRIIHTISRPQDLAALRAIDPHARVVLERMTSMRRHGMGAPDLWAIEDRHEGVSIHLPLAGSNYAEARRLMDDVVGAGASTVWLSHLTTAELDRLRSEFPDVTFRMRVGTRLWLGAPEAMSVTATVIDVHELQRGDAFGYRGRHALRNGHLIIASGGTGHGIGLTAPTGDSSPRARAAAAARGALDAAGLVRSPYFLDGRQLYFAEPPHMQASQLLLPQGHRVPEVGEALQLRVRHTTTSFDSVTIS